MKKNLLILGLLALPLINFAQVTNGLVAKYSFNSGNANDEVGTNNGVVNGATLTTDRFGNANKAYSFVSGGNIALPDAPQLKSSIMTVSLWVKINGYEASNVSTNYIYSVVNTTTNAYFAAFCMSVYSTDGRYLNVTQNGPSESTLGFSSAANTASWQHYVMSIDNDSLKMYIDGQWQWSLYKGFVTTYTNDSVLIGATGNTTYYGNLNGNVDDIRVYNRVLTATDVDSLFNETDPMTVGIYETEFKKNEMNIFPNPTHSLLNIQITEPTIISISNVLGQELINKKIQTNEAIDVSNFENGIYFLKDLNSGNTIKFIKQ